MSYFYTDTVLLGRERQSDEVFCLEVAFSGCGRKDAVAATEGSVFEELRGALWFGSHVLNGLEDGEVDDDDHIALRH